MGKQTAFYPKTLDEALVYLKNLHEEDKTETDYMRGYRQGLRLGMRAIVNVSDHEYNKKNENQE